MRHGWTLNIRGSGNVRSANAGTVFYCQQMQQSAAGNAVIVK